MTNHNDPMRGKQVAAEVAAEGAEDEFVVLATVPWPALSDKAFHGIVGEIVNKIAPHTEADPAAILLQLHAVFGACVGHRPHIEAGNTKHHAVIHPLIVGRTSDGAKGTAFGVVEAIRKAALPEFTANVTSGLSSAEGLIEAVRDPSGMPDDDDFDPGVEDKRLLIVEPEYRTVLTRSRREGNTLGPVMRQCWDSDPLRTLTRKRNKLAATDHHVVVIGHITPKEFKSVTSDTDLSGGSINRLLLCLSRRARRHSRLGNIPDDVVAEAQKHFQAAYVHACGRGELKFADRFWTQWDRVYVELTKERPDTKADEATARAVPQVLRLALLYALFDCAEVINVDHLDAALALWSYCEASARWLFSNHELERQRETHGALAKFIRKGGLRGRSRTEISRDYFKGNADKEQISAELAALVHDGTVIGIELPGKTRTVTRYVHRGVRNNEITKNAGQRDEPATNRTNSSRTISGEDSDSSSEFVDYSEPKTRPDQHSSSSSLVRSTENKPREQGAHERSLAPPGGLTPDSPGQTNRVLRAVAKAQADREQLQVLSSICGCEALLPGNRSGRCAECQFIARQEVIAQQIGALDGEPA